MAGGRRYHGPGIVGVLDLIRDHQDEIEFDLIALGLRLRHVGTPDFNWRDLYVILKTLPRDTALYRAVYGEDAEWTLEAHLLALVADAGNWLVWSKTRDGEKGRNRPGRVPRPGVASDTESRSMGSGALPAEELEAWLDGPFVALDG